MKGIEPVKKPAVSRAPGTAVPAQREEGKAGCQGVSYLEWQGTQEVTSHNFPEVRGPKSGGEPGQQSGGGLPEQVEAPAPKPQKEPLFPRLLPQQAEPGHQQDPRKAVVRSQQLGQNHGPQQGEQGGGVHAAL